MTAERSIANGWERFVASDWWRRLDTAQASTYQQIMLDLRKQRNSEGQAKDAFAALLDGLTGGPPPDYNDPFVAVSYLIEYQLSHCAMAFAVWWNFFDQHGAPARLSVFDFGAGGGAGAVGLQLALVLRKQAKLPYVPSNRLSLGAYEPCEPMRQIGECFLRQLGLLKPNYLGLQNLREWERADSVLAVVTSFHPALPWDTEGVGLDAVGRDFQRTMSAIRPDIVLGTCNTNKVEALRHLLGESSISEVITFPVDGLADFSNRLSSFFWNSVPIKDGFEDPRADGDPPKSLKYRSLHRFSFPRDPRVLEKLAKRYISPQNLSANLGREQVPKPSLTGKGSRNRNVSNDWLRGGVGKKLNAARKLGKRQSYGAVSGSCNKNESGRRKRGANDLCGMSLKLCLPLILSLGAN